MPGGFIDRASLVDPPDQWPAWSFDWEPLDDGHDPDDAVVESWSPDHSVLAAQPGGFISVDRATSQHDPPPGGRSVAGHAAASLSGLHRRRRRTLDGPFAVPRRRFAVGDRAWGVLGGREMGKSSLLMSLHRVGLSHPGRRRPRHRRPHRLLGPPLSGPAPERRRTLRGRHLPRRGRHQGALAGVPASRPLPARLRGMGEARVGRRDLHRPRRRGDQAAGAAGQLRAHRPRRPDPGDPRPAGLSRCSVLGRPRSWDRADEAVGSTGRRSASLDRT